MITMELTGKGRACIPAGLAKTLDSLLTAQSVFEK